MKVGIIGTRGIPNAYGGFEQFAEFLSVYLVERGHQVSVYNSHLHPYQESSWQGVEIIHCRDWEDKIGTAGQFVYDLNCIRDSRKRSFDVLLQLGYTSSSIWHWLLPKSSLIMTNMDGMEWKRSKFSGMVQGFLRHAERWAVKSSDVIVADSKAIKTYIDQKYQVDAQFIAYGARLVGNMNTAVLSEFGLESLAYNMLVARMEPENNIEMILDGQLSSESPTPFLVVGDSDNAFSHYLRDKFKSVASIRFLGGIFDADKLDALRQHAGRYFHGHSVGGTNPSLLEAMACRAYISAHDNPFNRAVLGSDASYFKSKEEVADILRFNPSAIERTQRLEANYRKIEETYNWPQINGQYEALMQKFSSKQA